MICSAITRQGYINIMLSTNYGWAVDSPISCPHHVVPKLGEIVTCKVNNCKECWVGVLSKVKFRGDLL